MKNVIDKQFIDIMGDVVKMAFLDAGFYFVFLLILNKPAVDITNTDCYLIDYGNLHKDRRSSYRVILLLQTLAQTPLKTTIGCSFSHR